MVPTRSIENEEEQHVSSTDETILEATFAGSTPVPVPASSAYPPAPPCIQSPFNWSSKRKIFTTCLSCTVTVASGYASGSNNAAGTGMGSAWHVSQTILLLGTTTYCTGFALAPMFLAPFSEITGRKPVFIFSGILFAISQLGCAVTNSLAGFLVARFFTGVGSSTFSTMVGGVMADIYTIDQRNTPMSIFAGAAFFGTGLGPLVSGVIAYHLHWRWVFFVQAICCGTLAAISFFLFEETRENVLLAKQAQALNRWFLKCRQLGMQGVNIDGEVRQVRWVTAGGTQLSLLQLIHTSVSRPFYLLVTEPVVFWFSLWMAFAWGVLYLSFAGIPVTFADAYNFNSQQTGTVFTAMTVGALCGVALNVFQERLRPLLGNPIASPESRLHFACVECAFFPIGVFVWAWTCRASVHWIVPSIAIGIATIGTYTIFLVATNYTADTYHRLASSALAAQSLTRNILGGVFPLATDAMFRRMTNAGALSFLGGVGVLLSLVPWVLLIYGHNIRARSKVAREMVPANKETHTDSSIIDPADREKAIDV